MNNKNMVTHSTITRKILLPYWKEFCDFKRANETLVDSVVFLVVFLMMIPTWYFKQPIDY